MEQRELEIYNKVINEKYKFYNFWRITAIIFMCLTILFAVLYFASGSVITTEQNNNDNDIEIVNDGGGNKNFVTVNN